jgi:predicted nuclease of predicted toxin-antitoxin system
MKYGRVRFYADEDIEDELVAFIREEGYRVFSARELGLSPRDDRHHLQEARKRKCVLLTRDLDYLSHRRFPFTQLKDTAIVILRTPLSSAKPVAAGFALTSLLKEVADSGRRNLQGLKIEIQGPRITLHARIRGRIRSEEVDISSTQPSTILFDEEPHGRAA